MHFGVSIPNNQGIESVRSLVDIGVQAERIGYQSLWVSEHLFHASYVDQRLGNKPYHEALTVLTACATATNRVQLGTSVLVLPWHHPARLAKSIASLDNLSDGRVILGIGVANAEDEFAALGIAFRKRGRIANEMLSAMQSLWQDEFPAHKGEFYQFEGLRFSPKPMQTPHPPIWVGGNSDAAITRLVRFGQGWHPLRQSPKEVAQKRELIRARLHEAGREDADSFPIAVRLAVEFLDKPSDRSIDERRSAIGTVDEIRALINAYGEAGATHIIADSRTSEPAQIQELYSRFMTEVATP